MHQDDTLTPDYVVTEKRHWDGSERRGIDLVSLQLMTEFRVVMEKHEAAEALTFAGIRKDVHDNKIASEQRHEELLDRFSQMQDSTLNALNANNATTREIHKMFKEAFPEGDVLSHRKAHEHWIAKDKEDREFWVKLKQDVVKWVAIAAMGWGGLVLWAAFLKGPGA